VEPCEVADGGEKIEGGRFACSVFVEPARKKWSDHDPRHDVLHWPGVVFGGRFAILAAFDSYGSEGGKEDFDRQQLVESRD
jgi:hypothetical protein